MGQSVLIASGKGGVGKSTIAALLCRALARNGSKCILVDGDIGLRCLDLLLGMQDRVIYDLFDVTEGNTRCLREGTLDFLINQHPEWQAFNALECLLHYLLYGATDNELRTFLPIDIVFKENLPFWHDIL